MDKNKAINFGDKVASLARAITACQYCGVIMGESAHDKCEECGEVGGLINLEDAVDLIIELKNTIDRIKSGGAPTSVFLEEADDDYSFGYGVVSDAQDEEY